jgi:hypothetical protein
VRACACVYGDNGKQTAICSVSVLSILAHTGRRACVCVRYWNGRQMATIGTCARSLINRQAVCVCVCVCAYGKPTQIGDGWLVLCAVDPEPTGRCVCVRVHVETTGRRYGDGWLVSCCRSLINNWRCACVCVRAGVQKQRAQMATAWSIGRSIRLPAGVRVRVAGEQRSQMATHIGSAVLSILSSHWQVCVCVCVYGNNGSQMATHWSFIVLSNLLTLAGVCACAYGETTWPQIDLLVGLQAVDLLTHTGRRVRACVWRRTNRSQIATHIGLVAIDPELNWQACVCVCACGWKQRVAEGDGTLAGSQLSIFQPTGMRACVCVWCSNGRRTINWSTCRS